VSSSPEAASQKRTVPSWLAEARTLPSGRYATAVTFATLMLVNNAPLKDVQEILGHARPSHTLNLYWQSVPGASEPMHGQVREGSGLV